MIDILPNFHRVLVLSKFGDMAPLPVSREEVGHMIAYMPREKQNVGIR